MLTDEEQQALLVWYDAEKRELPWRQTQDPWHILLSEILLQQTQVSRGIVFWERMVQAFPTVESMANASVDTVLKAWEGAGYYSRARRLHALSQQVMLPASEGGFDGRLPSTYTSLLSLPGIGPYTAAAVASIAFGEPVACVDGNIRRVMARRTADENPGVKAVQSWADASLVADRPGDWNQALMELGATVCKPRRVGCGTCPIESSCTVKGRAEHFPAAKKQRTKAVRMVAVVEFAEDGHPMLTQRPMQGMFAGMWGPSYQDQAPTSEEAFAYCGEIQHALSHRKITVGVFLSKKSLHKKGTKRGEVALSSMDVKVLDLAKMQAKSRHLRAEKRPKHCSPHLAT